MWLIWALFRVCNWASLRLLLLRNCLRCRRPRFNPWVGKIPWGREWLSSPVFLPGESMGRGAWWLQSMGSQRVGCNSTHAQSYFGLSSQKTGLGCFENAPSMFLLPPFCRWPTVAPFVIWTLFEMPGAGLVRWRSFSGRAVTPSLRHEDIFFFLVWCLFN